MNAGVDWTTPARREPQVSRAWTYALMVACVDLFFGVATGSVLAVIAVDAFLLVTFAVIRSVESHRELSQLHANFDEDCRIRQAAYALERGAGR